MNPVEKFFKNAEDAPKNLAVVAAEYQSTYADLAKITKILASAFESEGVVKGSRVAVMTLAELEIPISLALLQLGAISLHGGISVLTAYGRDIDFIISSEVQFGVKVRKSIIVNADYLSTLGRFAPKENMAQLGETDLVRIVFSSGTTGTPKGVPFTVKNLLARISSANQNWMPSQPFMSLLGLDTVTGMQTFFWMIFTGSPYLVPGNAESNFDLIKRFGVNSIKTSPAKLGELLQAVETKNETFILSAVQVAGSLLSENRAERCERHLGVIPTYLYGSTEVGTVTKGSFLKGFSNNVGNPVSDIDFEIVDDQKNVVKTGKIGNIRYRKSGMPSSYWGLESDGKTGFIDGWFYPGDLGSQNERGELTISGRTNDVVNAGGTKFNLLELDIWLGNSELFDDVASFTYLNTFDEVEVGIAFVKVEDPIPELIIRRLQEFVPGLQVNSLIRLAKLPRNKLDKVNRAELTKIARNLG